MSQFNDLLKSEMNDESLATWTNQNYIDVISNQLKVWYHFRKVFSCNCGYAQGLWFWISCDLYITWILIVFGTVASRFPKVFIFVIWAINFARIFKIYYLTRVLVLVGGGVQPPSLRILHLCTCIIFLYLILCIFSLE